VTAGGGSAIRHVVLYGSLRRGQSNFTRLRLAAALRFARTVRFRGLMYDLGHYPGVVDGDGEVVGELFAILDPGVVARLDELEVYRPHDLAIYDPATGKGSLYLRTVVEAGGVPAHLYLYNGPASELVKPVASGDWVRRRSQASRHPGPCAQDP
jgi:gamma-glutamylcyclotransferase (GGCT)/AIG2-like uncharacterized protein YtfP